MSNYVFKDLQRKKILYVKDCNVSNIDIKYYCPTPNCKARLTLRSLNGERDPYFAALPSNPHDDFCTISNLSGRKANYDVSNFSIETLYSLITSKSGSNSSTSGGSNANASSAEYESEQINTTSKLYYFCKGHDINYMITDQVKVGDLIADSRTNFLFTKGIWKLRLVECKFHRYIDATNSIEFDYPIDSSLKNQHKLTVTFDDHNDYIKIVKKIFSNNKKYSSAHIGILGEWVNNKCIVSHWKQIIVV